PCAKSHVRGPIARPYALSLRWCQVGDDGAEPIVDPVLCKGAKDRPASSFCRGRKPQRRWQETAPYELSGKTIGDLKPKGTLGLASDTLRDRLALDLIALEQGLVCM